MAMNPKIKEYFRRKGVLPEGYDDADQEVDDANQADANMGWAKVAGQMSDNFSNASNQDIILKNKHSALGNQPNVIEAKKQRTDFSLADSLGQNRKGAAQAKLEQMKADMRARLGGQQADEKLEFDRAEGAQKQSNFEAKMAQDERAMQSQAASRQAYADATMGLKRDEIAAKREALTQKPNTAEQFKVAGFGQRMEQAEAEMEKIQQAGYDRSSVASGIGSMLPNLVRGTDAQQQDQAERNFVNALLRKESGAAISPTEFASAQQQYFPRAGDSAEVIAQKKRNRQLATQALKAEAAGAWDQVGGVGQSNEHDEALNWARANPDDPRAQQIIKLNAGK